MDKTDSDVDVGHDTDAEMIKNSESKKTLKNAL